MGGLLICLGWDYYIGELWSKGGGGTLLKMNYQVDIKTFSSESVLRIRIRWIRKILACWIRIQGVKYHQKTALTFFLLLNPKSELLKKERLKKFTHFWMIQVLG